jgi:hypothetical protein
MADSFQIAQVRARLLFTQHLWDTLSQRERTDAIYLQLRRIDAENLRDRLAAQTAEKAAQSSG